MTKPQAEKTPGCQQDWMWTLGCIHGPFSFKGIVAVLLFDILISGNFRISFLSGFRCEWLTHFVLWVCWIATIFGKTDQTHNNFYWLKVCFGMMLQSEYCICISNLSSIFSYFLLWGTSHPSQDSSHQGWLPTYFSRESINPHITASVGLRDYPG